MSPRKGEVKDGPVLAELCPLIWVSSSKACGWPVPKGVSRDGSYTWYLLGVLNTGVRHTHMGF
jgi:hypothetical protein